jgi:hypothetical protein
MIEINYVENPVENVQKHKSVKPGRCPGEFRG